MKKHIRKAAEILGFIEPPKAAPRNVASIVTDLTNLSVELDARHQDQIKAYDNHRSLAAAALQEADHAKRVSGKIADLIA